MLLELGGQVIRISILVFLFGTPSLLVGGWLFLFCLHIRRFSYLLHWDEVYFKPYPSIEVYGYQAIHNEMYDSLSIWSRFRLRFHLLGLFTAAVFNFECSKVNSLIKALRLLRSQFETKQKAADWDRVVERIISLLYNQEIGKAKRLLGASLNSNLKVLDRDAMLSLILFNEMLQGIDSPEKLLSIDPQEERRIREQACRELAELLKCFWEKIDGYRYTIYDAIMKKELEYELAI